MGYWHRGEPSEKVTPGVPWVGIWAHTRSTDTQGTEGSGRRGPASLPPHIPKKQVGPRAPSALQRASSLDAVPVAENREAAGQPLRLQEWFRHPDLQEKVHASPAGLPAGRTSSSLSCTLGNRPAARWPMPQERLTTDGGNRKHNSSASQSTKNDPWLATPGQIR